MIGVRERHARRGKRNVTDLRFVGVAPEARPAFVPIYSHRTGNSGGRRLEGMRADRPTRAL